MTSTLASLLFAQRGSYNPEATALVLPKSAGHEAQFTYAEVDQFVRHIQGQLASLQLPKGAVVSSSLINNVEFVASFLAIAEQG